MPRYFRVTYEIVTPESAEQGDNAESGFEVWGGWRDSVSTVKQADVDSGVYNMRLRTARDIAWPIEDAGAWFVGEDSTLDYQTGSTIRRSIHAPDNITGASYERVKRALGIKH